MAGHVQDRWYKIETTPDGRPHKVRSDRYGTGMRYRARYVGPDGTEKSKSFPDRQKRQAEQWLARIEADMSRGQFVDPAAGRVTFRQYGERWLASQTTDPATRGPVASQLRRHAFPHLGARPMGSFTPTHIREWLVELERVIPASSYRRVIFSSVSSVFTAAMDDGIISKNPCQSRTVRRPESAEARVVPWSADRVMAVRKGLPEAYRAMVDVGGGCGLRQGEIFGLPVDAVGFDTGWLHVGQQVKNVHGHLVFAPPKRGKVRDVPLPDHVANVLKLHMERFPPVAVTLPWISPDGPPRTALLFFTAGHDGAVRRPDFNVYAWKPALVAADVIPPRQEGARRHVAAREHGMHALRHFYASVLLEAGENIKALSQYLGHSNPGFTLRVYTHLMPSSEGRTRRAVDAVFKHSPEHDHGPQAAQSD